jgi:hypothetical protein
MNRRSVKAGSAAGLTLHDAPVSVSSKETFQAGAVANGYRVHPNPALSIKSEVLLEHRALMVRMSQIAFESLQKTAGKLEPVTRFAHRGVS